MPPRGRGRAPFTTRISEDRVASLTCLFGNISLYLKPPDDEAEEVTPGVTMMGKGSKSYRDMSWSLTQLTVEELAKFKAFMELAISLAEPIVAERDKAAVEAFERGDDSHNRIFRQKPVLVVRPARRKVERAFGAELHNALVDMMEAQKEYIMLNVNEIKSPLSDEDTDFGGPDEYRGEDAADADINLPLEK